MKGARLERAAAGLIPGRGFVDHVQWLDCRSWSVNVCQREAVSGSVER